MRRRLGARAMLIFLLPPSLQELRRRLMGRRTETLSSMRRRLAAAKRELSCAAWYDCAVVNDRLQDTVARVGAVITAKRRRAEGNERGQDG